MKETQPDKVTSAEKMENNQVEILILNPRSREFQEAVLSDPRVMELLEKLKDHDEDTYRHSLKVGLFSIDLGFSYNLDEERLAILGCAANLHDIGKLKIDLNILDKEGALTAEERTNIKTHTGNARDILGENDFKEAMRIAVTHHEHQADPYPRSHRERRADACGNERRTPDEEMEFLGEIIAAADMMDALVSVRAYKDALPKDKVIEIIRSEFRGDPDLIDKIIDRLQ